MQKEKEKQEQQQQEKQPITKYQEEQRKNMLIRLQSSEINTRVLQIVINNQILNNTQIENLKKISENTNKMNVKVEGILLK